MLVLAVGTFLSGFVDAIAGGGGLISLPCYLMVGLPPHAAIGTNHVSGLLGSATAAVQFHRHGYVDWALAPACVVAGLIASALGARTALLVPEDILKAAMLVVLPLVAAYVLTHRDLGDASDPLPPRRTLALCVAITFGASFYDGFYGPGSGTFLIVALTALAHVSMQTANGLSKAVFTATNLASTLVFFTAGKVLVGPALLGSACCMLGNYVGSNRFHADGMRIARPIMLGVLTLFFIQTVRGFLA